MTDLERHVEGPNGIPKEGGQEPAPHGKQRGRSRTAGTDSDFDADSKNMGHGHPREERGTSDAPVEGKDYPEK